MKEKDFAKWNKYRKLGKLRFNLLWGLYFSMLMTVIPFIYDAIKNEFTFEIDKFLIRVIIGALIGIFIGRIRWENNERNYAEYFDKKDGI